MMRATDWLWEARMRARLTLVATAAALAIAGTACGGPTVEVGAPPTPTPKLPESKTLPGPGRTDPLADPNSPRRVVYAPGLVSDPLPARQRNVGVDRAAIEKKVGRKEFGPARQPGTAEATLRLVTLGLPESRAAARPAWVLTWSDSQPDIKGPAGRSAKERRALADKLSCVFVLVVDANTGASLDARQLCQAKDSQ